MRVAIAGSNCLAYWLGSMLKNHPLHHFIILSRSPKPAFSSNGWPVHVVNFNNENDLIHNLGGVDIVISMVTGDTQLLLIDAALKAHVTRFVPSEFAGQHNKRPATLNRGHVFAINRLKQHIEEGMYFTVFACGIFYDTFVPGGLRSSNMGHVSTNGNNGEGSFLMDLRSKRAQIPLDASGRPAKICMTLIFDVARFIVAAMDIPLHKWPREFRMRGERLDVSSIVRLAENLRGQSFERFEYSRDALQSQLQLAQNEGNAAETLRFNKLIAASDGAYDFNDANLNNMVNFTPSRFEEWLGQVWHGYL